MFLLEVFGKIFIELIFEGIILGLYRLLKRVYVYLKTRLFGRKHFIE